MKRRSIRRGHISALLVICIAATVVACEDELLTEELGVVTGFVTLDTDTYVSGARVVFTAEDGTAREVLTNDQGAYQMPDLPRGVHQVTVYVPNAACPPNTFDVELTSAQLSINCLSLGGTYETNSTPRTNTCAIEDEAFTTSHDLSVRTEGGATEVDMDHEGAPTASGTYDVDERWVFVSTPWVDLGGGVEAMEEFSLDLVWNSLQTAFELRGTRTFRYRSTETDQACEVTSDIVMTKEA